MDQEYKLKEKNAELKKILAAALAVLTLSIIFNFKDVIFPRLGFLTSFRDSRQALTLEEKVLPSAGVELPIVWGDLGKQMIEAGVIDAKKFEQIYAERGGLSPDEKKLLEGGDNGRLVINKQNAPFLLNLLWAYGLGNESDVLSKGPIGNPRLVDAGKLASTAGWTLARGNAMEHMNMHEFVYLDELMQNKIAKVASTIYRPCCDNPTIFPDCNHGMAMLGLLELLAASGASELEMYDIALQVNSYWFPENYLTIAKYFEAQGVEWENVIAQDVLGYGFSSNTGYAQILSKVETPDFEGGDSSCSA